jgi:hypothetical protein
VNEVNDDALYVPRHPSANDGYNKNDGDNDDGCNVDNNDDSSNDSSLPRSKHEMVTMTVTAATRTTTTAATGTTTTTTATMGTTTTTAATGAMTTAAAAAAPSLAQSARRRGPLSFLFVLTSRPPTSSLVSRCSRGGFLFFSFLFHCCI